MSWGKSMSSFQQILPSVSYAIAERCLKEWLSTLFAKPSQTSLLNISLSSQELAISVKDDWSSDCYVHISQYLGSSNIYWMISKLHMIIEFVILTLNFFEIFISKIRPVDPCCDLKTWIFEPLLELAPLILFTAAVLINPGLILMTIIASYNTKCE